MENVFGVDVAKHWIDVAGPDGHERIAGASWRGLPPGLRGPAAGWPSRRRAAAKRRSGRRWPMPA